MAPEDDREQLDRYAAELRHVSPIQEILDAFADELVVGKPVVVTNLGLKNEQRVAWSESSYFEKPSEKPRTASEPFTAGEALSMLGNILNRGLVEPGAIIDEIGRSDVEALHGLSESIVLATPRSRVIEEGPSFAAQEVPIDDTQTRVFPLDDADHGALARLRRHLLELMEDRTDG